MRVCQSCILYIFRKRFLFILYKKGVFETFTELVLIRFDEKKKNCLRGVRVNFYILFMMCNSSNQIIKFRLLEEKLEMDFICYD